MNSKKALKLIRKIAHKYCTGRICVKCIFNDNSTDEMCVLEKTQRTAENNMKGSVSE